jgi:cyclopropane fatty-acyl-phospholipid synthase-like methyltransferase
MRASQNGEESGRFSNGLKEFLWQIGDIGKGSLLDLGAVSQATVTYFIERNFKVYTEDLLAGWGAFLEHETQRAASLAGTEEADPSPTARADRFLASNLRYTADTFDAVLLWDLLDYLDKEAARQFLRRITSLVREGGAVLAIFHTRPPEQFQRYRVLDAHNLAVVSAPTLVQPRHVYNNREIQELFEKFRTSKTFVARDQLREGVFVK